MYERPIKNAGPLPRLPAKKDNSFIICLKCKSKTHLIIKESHLSAVNIHFYLCYVGFCKIFNTNLLKGKLFYILYCFL